MLEELKTQVYNANLLLPKYHLVHFTWGNVSGIDRKSGYVVIKPSGVEYEEMSAQDMVVVDLEGNVIEGRYKPSSDTPTHIELYQSFPKIGGIVHTHSTYATSFAQARKGIAPYGTTHADYFYGEIPCTRILSKEEVEVNYEKNTGRVIAETFLKKDDTAIPGVLVANHGVFAWGDTPSKAVCHAAVIEQVAQMAYQTITLQHQANSIPLYILEKHYQRKHGKNAYYGQN